MHPPLQLTHSLGTNTSHQLHHTSLGPLSVLVQGLWPRVPLNGYLPVFGWLASCILTGGHFKIDEVQRSAADGLGAIVKPKAPQVLRCLDANIRRSHFGLIFVYTYPAILFMTWLHLQSEWPPDYVPVIRCK